MKTGTIGRVQSPRIIRLGAGVADETADVLLQLGLSAPLIVTDGYREGGFVHGCQSRSCT